LGDSIQTLAVQAMLASIGIAEDVHLLINRDALSNYANESAKFIMHGVFGAHCFPISEALTPIFFGFNSDERTIFANRQALKRFAPIGCRDTYTTALARAHGIPAYTSGCLTLSFPVRSTESASILRSHFIIAGDGEGAFPEELLAYAPKTFPLNITRIHQRAQAACFPIPRETAVQHLRSAKALLQRYRREANLIITPLLHAATPALAMGIPTIVVRKAYSPRFSALSRLIPIHLPRDFSSIDWSPHTPDFSALKVLQRQAFTDALTGGMALSPAQKELDIFWGQGKIEHTWAKRMARLWSTIH
jgi:hypothetical protein